MEKIKEIISKPSEGSDASRSYNDGNLGGEGSHLPGSSQPTSGGGIGGEGSHLGSSSYEASKGAGISSYIPGAGSSSNQDSTTSDNKGTSSLLPGGGSGTTEQTASAGPASSYAPGVRPSADRQNSEPGNSAFVETSYKARSYQLPGRHDLPGSEFKSDTGPHSTETANRLDPNLGATAGAGAVGTIAAGTAAATGASQTSKAPEPVSEKWDSSDPVSPSQTRGTSALVADDSRTKITPPGEFAKDDPVSADHSVSTGSAWDSGDPVSPSQTRGSSAITADDSKTKITPPGDFAKDDPVSADDSTSKGYGTGAAIAGETVLAGAGGYGAYEATRDEHAEVVGGPSDSLKDRINPAKQTDLNQKGLVLDLVKDPETGKERFVMSGPGLDSSPPPRDSVDSSKVSEGGTPQKERRGSKLKSMLGLNKDKSRSSTDENRGDSPRQSTNTDDNLHGGTAAVAAAGGPEAYNASELSKNERTSTADSGIATSGGSKDYGGSEPVPTNSGASGEGFTIKYNMLPGEDHPNWVAGEGPPRENENTESADSGEKKSRRFSDIFRRKDPNKLHKDPPEGYTAE